MERKKYRVWDKLFHTKLIIAFLFLNKKVKLLPKVNQLCNHCTVGLSGCTNQHIKMSLCLLILSSSGYLVNMLVNG